MWLPPIRRSISGVPSRGLLWFVCIQAELAGQLCQVVRIEEDADAANELANLRYIGLGRGQGFLAAGDEVIAVHFATGRADPHAEVNDQSANRFLDIAVALSGDELQVL